MRAPREGVAVSIVIALLLSSCATVGNHSRSGGTPQQPKIFGDSCTPITKLERKEILRLANPKNFPNTRYKKRWNDRKPIEQETDCSKFVHEIYRRAGLPFPRSTTKAIGDLNYFRQVGANQAKPGDLVVFPKHVGILAWDGEVISATQRGGRRGLATKSNRDPRFRSSIVKSPKENFSSRYYFLQYACRPDDGMIND